MSATKTMSKSEAIREHLKTTKDKSPKAIVKALKEKGVVVTPGHVSVIKFEFEGGKKSRRKSRISARKARKSNRTEQKFTVREILDTARSMPSTNGEAVPEVSALVKAKELLAKAGDLKKAHAFLDAVNSIIHS